MTFKPPFFEGCTGYISDGVLSGDCLCSYCMTNRGKEFSVDPDPSTVRETESRVDRAARLIFEEAVDRAEEDNADLLRTLYAVKLDVDMLVGEKMDGLGRGG